MFSVDPPTVSLLFRMLSKTNQRGTVGNDSQEDPIKLKKKEEVGEASNPENNLQSTDL